jgi:hypothetical protein
MTERHREEISRRLRPIHPPRVLDDVLTRNQLESDLIRRHADPGHLDSPRFRGMGLMNTPIWLLSVMGRSGLFQAWAIELAEVIVWFQKDAEGGGFSYWPDGPLAPPQRLVPPLRNRGVVTHNTAMDHRGESKGPPEQRANPKGLGFDSTFGGDPTVAAHAA